MSSRPKSRAVCSTAAVTWARSSMSVGTVSARRPSARISPATPPSSLAVRAATSAPACAMPRAIARPMPRPPPVTRATLPARLVMGASGPGVSGEHAPTAGASAFHPLACPLADEGAELVDRLLDLGVVRTPFGEQGLRVLELAERLLEVAAQLRGHGEVVETFPFLSLAAERDTNEAVGLVEVGVERERALELRERGMLIAGLGERLADLEVRPAVVGMPGEVAPERLASSIGLLERVVDGAERPI